MSTLLGQTTPTNTGSGQTTPNVLYWQRFTAFASGVASSINAYVQSVLTATGLWLALYDSSGSLLASGDVTPATAGLNTASISNLAITNGVQYYIAWIVNSGNILLADNKDFMSVTNVGPNSTQHNAPPANLPAIQNTQTVGFRSVFVDGILASQGAPGLAGPSVSSPL